MDFILGVYRIERAALDADLLGAPEQPEIRQTQSKEVIDDFKMWLLAEHDRHPPRGPMGEAISYALGQWDALTLFLTDPHLPIDNNASERALRVAALGRKNFLFVGTDEAGENVAGISSLIATCEVNGVNPGEYIADVLMRVQSHPASRIDELLPHNWKPPRPDILANTWRPQLVGVMGSRGALMLPSSRFSGAFRFWRSWSTTRIQSDRPRSSTFAPLGVEVGQDRLVMPADAALPNRFHDAVLHESCPVRASGGAVGEHVHGAGTARWNRREREPSQRRGAHTLKLGLIRL